ncbi:hypothetical protein BRE01_54830 [Brevibacillus reuszeri]|uniref:Uncharacterized protein n=1 Tax=Brevibacillus reuszeri TaxID=54915 RepID=A0A0K9YQD2_9BACL|nr:hypothetical protein [Brevibacillus reuszeri]KNB70385.1 hypothetical protein ADS79_15680 [Brevibacillus reuszeri]MED1857914.1 hypothetical protein [Brevibacillus reuszeri]GED71781.1 hypothetical protein BRE01_54830 [Brevibacillus reuszeri]
MNDHSDFNAEMQQVSAYPTKQKIGQEEVALLNEQDSCCCSGQSSCDTSKNGQASKAEQR